MESMNKNYEKSDSDVADADANRYKRFFINFLNLHIISMNMEKKLNSYVLFM